MCIRGGMYKGNGLSVTLRTTEEPACCQNKGVTLIGGHAMQASKPDLSEDFKMTKIGPLPEEWQIVRLGEVLREMDVRVRDLGESAYELPILSLTKNEGLVLQTERFGKRIATEDVSEYKVVYRGQIVYNPYVIWEGAVHILDKYEAGLVSPVYPVWEVRPDKAHAWFIDPLLRMPNTISAYNRFASGAVNRRRAIRKNDFLSIPIPLPLFLSNGPSPTCFARYSGPRRLRSGSSQPSRSSRRASCATFSPTAPCRSTRRTGSRLRTQRSALFRSIGRW